MEQVQCNMSKYRRILFSHLDSNGKIAILESKLDEKNDSIQNLELTIKGLKGKNLIYDFIFKSFEIGES